MYVSQWCYFFFFKQKTAYEMRISDWSSDVCSSDLAWPTRPTAATRRTRSPAPRQRRPKAQSRRWPGRRRPDRQRASWRWLLVLVVGAVTADVIADQRDGIARLGTLGHEVVLQAGANALQDRKSTRLNSSH